MWPKCFISRAVLYLERYNSHTKRSTIQRYQMSQTITYIMYIHSTKSIMCHVFVITAVHICLLHISAKQWASPNVHYHILYQRCHILTLQSHIMELHYTHVNHQIYANTWCSATQCHINNTYGASLAIVPRQDSAKTSNNYQTFVSRLPKGFIKWHLSLHTKLRQIIITWCSAKVYCVMAIITLCIPFNIATSALISLQGTPRVHNAYRTIVTSHTNCVKFSYA